MCHRRCLSNVVLPPVSESPTLSLNADLWPLPRPTKWSYLKEDLQTAYLPVFVSSYFTLGFESHCPKLLKDYSKKTANFTPSFLRSHSRHDRSQLRFFIDALYQVEKVPLYSQFTECFYHQCRWIVSSAFSASMYMSM